MEYSRVSVVDQVRLIRGNKKDIAKKLDKTPRSNKSGNKSIQRNQASLKVSDEHDLESFINFFDSKGTGVLSLGEIDTTLRYLGMEHHSGLIKGLLSQYVNKSKGGIPVKDFKDLFSKVFDDELTENDYTNIFKSIDYNNSGFIDAQKLKIAFDDTGLPYTNDEIEDLVRLYEDKKYQGKGVNFNMFSQILNTPLK